MGKKNILEAKVLQSKVHGDQVNASEKWLGYLLGPSKKQQEIKERHAKKQ